MTDAQRIALTGALRLLLQKHEHAIRARLDVEQAKLEAGALFRAGTVERAKRALERAEFVLDASLEQVVDVLETTLSPERVVQ